MPQVQITQHTIQPREIAPIIADLENAIEGYSREASIIAMLSMIIIMQHPEISPEDLQRCVMESSRYICLVMDPTPTTEMN